MQRHCVNLTETIRCCPYNVKVDEFGESTLMKRPGQPLELAEAYVFFAWERASSYITGQCIHINGGDYISS